jgi:hypothetical protein
VCVCVYVLCMYVRVYVCSRGEKTSTIIRIYSLGQNNTDTNRYTPMIADTNTSIQRAPH